VKVSARTRAGRSEPEIHRLVPMDPGLCYQRFHLQPPYGPRCLRGPQPPRVCVISALAAFATVLPGATGIANAMSGRTRQQINEAMTAMLRMSASFLTAHKWRQAKVSQRRCDCKHKAQRARMQCLRIVLKNADAVVAGLEIALAAFASLAGFLGWPFPDAARPRFMCCPAIWPGSLKSKGDCQPIVQGRPEGGPAAGQPLFQA
jgi:hypothetical protein